LKNWPEQSIRTLVLLFVTTWPQQALANASSEAGFTAQLFRTLAALLLVLAAILLVAAVLRRLRPGFAPTTGRQLQLIESQPLGHGKTLYLLQRQQEQLLIAVCGDQIQLLARWPAMPATTDPKEPSCSA
jgi:flagellar biosynthetic protein FliO